MELKVETETSTNKPEQSNIIDDEPHGAYEMVWISPTLSKISFMYAAV